MDQFNLPTFDPDGEVEALYRAITGRPAFSYRAASDPLYRSYADRYVHAGRLAMRDAMGQAAALTGGYGSSYAQSAGQQQYDEYLLKLAEALPELYGLAYQQYADQGRQLSEDYDRAYKRAGDDYARAYQGARDAYEDRRYAEQQEAAAAQAAWKQQQSAYSNLVKLIQSSGYDPTDAELRAAGLNRSASDALRQEYLRARGLSGGAAAASSSGYGRSAGRGGSGGSGSGGGTDSAAAAAAASVGRSYVSEAQRLAYARPAAGGGGGRRTLMVR